MAFKGTPTRPSQIRRLKKLLRRHPVCFWCEAVLTIETITQDHFIPKRFGGSSHLRNIVGACYSCNTHKGDTMPTTGDLARLGRNPLTRANRNLPAMPEGETCAVWVVPGYRDSLKTQVRTKPKGWNG